MLHDGKLCTAIMLHAAQWHVPRQGLQAKRVEPRELSACAAPQLIGLYRCRQVLPQPGKILRERMPLHVSMTQSAYNRFGILQQRYQQALTLRTIRSNTAIISSSSPGGYQQQQRAQAAPQLLTVTVQGALLCKAHINIGSYIRPQELQRARKLLTGEQHVVRATDEQRKDAGHVPI
jgi:hypothetical protein